MFFQIVFVSLLQCLIGLGLCFAGFRLFVILLPVFGFFAGFLVTAQAIQELFGGGFLATASSWVFGFVVGVLFALVAYFFYYGAVVVLAVTVAYEFGVGIIAGVGVNSGFVQFIVGAVVALALAVAVVFLNLPRIIIVVLSALAGAGMILTGTLLALGRVSLVDLNLGLVGAFIRDSWLWSLVYLAIVAFGIAVQLLLPEDYSLEPYSQASMSLHAPVPTLPPRGAEPAV
ncbi:MAG TPA: hypothetical protein VGP82_22995 [Ktedonobacterales bacterium]|jgi:hypothetical protein|nr:hypothetical protein [Ktedonobacterales bacterium]